MENAADALKMAAAILIFILAIAASFSLFGTAKQTADSIIGMRDKQGYLQAAELDNGILYTSSTAITGNKVSGVTEEGYRVVGIDDVISTISRYSVEKYGVTIIEENAKTGTVLARFDSSTEAIMADFATYSANISDYQDEVEKNLKNYYLDTIKFVDDYKNIEDLYKLSSHTDKVYAFWYGNTQDIMERIKVDLYTGDFVKGEYTYRGKEIISKYLSTASKIIEVTNEIDNSKYLKEGTEDTNLLQQFEMPTVEIIYIIMS